MFDLGRTGELLLLVVLAVVLIGPKDFPDVLRFIGRVLGYIRRFSATCQWHIDRVIAEAEKHPNTSDNKLAQKQKNTRKNHEHK